MKITARQDTILKTHPIDSQSKDLPAGFKTYKIKAGTVLAVPNAYKSSLGNCKVVFDPSLTLNKDKHTELYAYHPHWEGLTAIYEAMTATATPFSAAGSSQVLHECEHFAQNNNEDWQDSGSASSLRYGGVQCGLTSCSIVLTNPQYLTPADKAKIIAKSPTGKFDDGVAAIFKEIGAASTSMEGHVAVFEELGFKAKARRDGTIADLAQWVQTKGPVVLGSNYKSSGHFIAVVGYDLKTGNFTIYDPYGDRNQDSTNQWNVIWQDESEVKPSIYSTPFMQIVWEAQPHDGWAVFVEPKYPKTAIAVAAEDHAVVSQGGAVQPVAGGGVAIGGGLTSKPEAMAAAIPTGLSRVTPLQATLFKAKPVGSGSLAADEKDSFDLDEGLIGVVAKAPAGHIMVTLPGSATIKGRNTWYLFAKHVQVETPGGASALAPGGPVTDADYDRVAKMIGCETRAFKTVVQVEAAGSGMFPSGKCKILFEAHWFADLTGQKYNQSHPHISSKSWNRDLYIGGEKEWGRLEEAMTLDRKAAIGSASYGLGQVMGAYAWEMPAMKIPGNSDLEKAENFLALNGSESGQLEIMGRFIMADDRLISALKSKNWAAFACAYSGESYAVNQYDIKLADAYAALG